jgi:hypothetical protein
MSAGRGLEHVVRALISGCLLFLLSLIFEVLMLTAMQLVVM